MSVVIKIDLLPNIFDEYLTSLTYVKAEIII